MVKPDTTRPTIVQTMTSTNHRLGTGVRTAFMSNGKIIVLERWIDGKWVKEANDVQP